MLNDAARGERSPAAGDAHAGEDISLVRAIAMYRADVKLCSKASQ
jgi:hypothetical protein